LPHAQLPKRTQLDHDFAPPVKAPAGLCPRDRRTNPLKWLAISAEERSPAVHAGPGVAEISHPLRPASRHKSALSCDLDVWGRLGAGYQVRRGPVSMWKAPPP
jgi:hypothetical protein